MASHLLWFRLPKGRVWHVACSGALVALCGQSIPARGERQPKRPPFGARPCPDCDMVGFEAQLSIAAAQLVRSTMETGVTDPEIVTLPDLLDSSQEGEKPEVEFPACEDCGHPFGNHDSLGVCQDVDENGDACECGEYLSLCTCGHPWALHDVDTGECCYEYEDPEDGTETSCTCLTFRPVGS